MISNSKSNPFAQVPHYWKIAFTLPVEAVGTAENAFDGMSLAISAFETEGVEGNWMFELLCETMPDMTEIQRRLLVLSVVCDVPIPAPTIQQIAQQDWLKQVARNFPPLTIGRFYVHGTHVSTPPPAGSISLQVDAGAAFGSGEHGTTHACLEAFEWMSRQRDFERILDMGCGSGILAIAAAKLWKTQVMAVDIDAVAVQVTKENARINQVTSYIEAFVSDGYANDKIRRVHGFDLIVSNILARPLIKFAPDLKANLKKGGLAILSGLLTSQEAQVRSAHQVQGLALKKRFVHGDWCTLVLQ